MNDNIRRSLEILELSVNASFEEAKQAYRDLVIIWHPDKHNTSNDRIKVKADLKLKLINSAWDDLKEYFSYRTAENNADEKRHKQEQAERETRQRRNEEQRTKQQAEQKRREEDEKQFHISKCPYCYVSNRIPSEKPIASAICGSCGKILDPKAKAWLDKEVAENKRIAEAAEREKREKADRAHQAREHAELDRIRRLWEETEREREPERRAQARNAMEYLRKKGKL
jgi:curved DNA-binding protein CbpA